VKHVLYVEDNPGDVLAVREALREVDPGIALHAVENAVQAFRFLARRDAYRDAPALDAILLDLNLPVLTGQRVLEELRLHPEWKHLLVVMFSSSPLPQDRAAAEALGAHFVVKPARWADHLELARRLQRCLRSRGSCTGEAAGSAS